MWHALLAFLLALSSSALAELDPTPNLIVLSTLTPISANTTLYMAPDAGVSSIERTVAVPLAVSMKFKNLACRTTGATGSGVNVPVTSRVGPCASLGDIPAFSCTILGGAAPGLCTTGPVSLQVGAQQCLALKIVTPVGLPAGIGIICSMERIA